MSAVDFGVFAPAAQLSPVRLASGVTELGRLTTTNEQHAESVGWILDRMRQRGVNEGSATIQWSRHEPTVLVVDATVEHVAGGRVYVTSRVTEQTPEGVEIVLTATERAARVRAEVQDLVERKML